MYVDVAVLKEAQPCEWRFALFLPVAEKLTNSGDRSQMQASVADSIHAEDRGSDKAFFAADRCAPVRHADIDLPQLSEFSSVFTRLKPGEVPSRAALDFAAH